MRSISITGTLVSGGTLAREGFQRIPNTKVHWSPSHGCSVHPWNDQSLVCRSPVIDAVIHAADKFPNHTKIIGEFGHNFITIK